MRPVKIVTANLDFALKPATVAKDLKRIIDNAEVVAFQEAKRVNVDRLIEDSQWKVFQKLHNDAVQGAGVAWRNARIRGRKRGLTMGTKPYGRGLLTRYIAWVRLDIKDETNEPHPLIVCSVHLPPKRFWGFIYNIMLSNIERFARARKLPIIFCGDWNKLVRRADDLKKLEKRVKGKFYGVGIDGFLVVDRGEWKVEGVRRLAETHSDHEPVQIRLTPTYKKR